MNNLSFMEKLLDGATVEWKLLWQVTTWDKRFNAVDNYKQPRIIKYNYLLANQIKPLIVYGGVVKLLTTNISSLWTTEELAGDIISEGEVIAIPWGGNVSVQYYKGKFLTSDNRIATSNDVNFLDNKFIYYFLLNNIDLLSSFYRGSGIKHPSMSKVLGMEIPIPPLHVQAEIVRILDKFTELTTELTAELTAELTMRKQQYNYYRDKLLSFEDGEVEWKTLGEVCRFINGRAYKQPELLESGKYPVLRVGNFFTNGNWYYSNLELDEDKYCDNGDLLYAWSASFGPKIWDGGKVIYHYHIWKVVPDTDLISKKYLFYLLAWDTEALKSEHGTGSTMMHVGKGAIEKRLLPVPSIAEQARIVSLLDKFDTLTNSITEGLPREIELRQKQYEYYRNLLLTFPKQKTPIEGSEMS